MPNPSTPPSFVPSPVSIAAQAIYEGLCSTHSAFLVSSEPVSSADELPPPSSRPFPHATVNMVQQMVSPPDAEQWNII
jgi:hypothetical protein